MTTKEKILNIFEKNKGSYLSGQDLADQLKISRSAVWKAVNALKDEGYKIDAVNKKGYCLSQETDILSSQGIYKYIGKNKTDLNIEVIPSLESTNLSVAERALRGEKEGYILIAKEQTRGRGRRGKAFYSPGDTGLYMSLLLRPKDLPLDRLTEITIMLALASSRAIDSLTGESSQIKWVNDIYFKKKRLPAYSLTAP